MRERKLILRQEWMSLLSRLEGRDYIPSRGTPNHVLLD